MQETCDAVIVAAGSGTRLGMSVPKAFVPLAGEPILTYSLAVFKAHAAIDRVILVVPETLLAETGRKFSGGSVSVVAGGAQRWESVRNGCSASEAEWVLVHDAARPFVTGAGIDTLLEKRNNFKCAITVTRVVDTIRTFDGETAGETIDRSKLVRVGTPQLFRLPLLKKGLDLASTIQPPPTDEAILMQYMKIPVGIAWGDPTNFKITTPEDLSMAEALIGARR